MGMNSRVVAIAVALTLGLAACSGGADDASSESADGAIATTVAASFDSASDDGSSDDAMEQDAMEEEAMEEEPTAVLATGRADEAAPQAGAPSQVGAGEQVQTGGQQGPEAETTDPVDTGRDIIRTAVVTAEVPDVAAASQQVINSVERVGGLLFNQDTRIGTGEQANRTTLVFRVPPSDFQRVLNDLDGVGTLLDKQVDATDVTGRVVDLRSRITSTELSVERLRGFLSGATDLNQIATFENELRNRETDLETLRGQLRTLENQVALSTITISLIEKLPPAPPAPSVLIATTVHAGHDDGFSCGARATQLEVGEDATICYEVTNNGATALANLNLRDAAMNLEIDDLTVVEGDLDDPLQPGEVVVLAYEFSADGKRIISTAKVQADAQPAIDAADIEVFADDVSASTDFALTVVAKQTDPGFTDGLSTGWDGLTNLIRVVLVLAGLVLPFIWAFPLAFFAFRALRRWNNEQRHRSAPRPPTPPAEPAASASGKEPAQV